MLKAEAFPALGPEYDDDRIPALVVVLDLAVRGAAAFLLVGAVLWEFRAPILSFLHW